MMRILEITVPVFGIVLVGYLYGRFRPVEMASANRLNINLFVPALIFHVLSEELAPGFELSMVALAAAVIILGSGLLAWPLVRLLGWDVRTVVPPAMFKNSGNFGLPLAVFAFGERALPVAVILFVVENTLHFTLGMWLLTRRLSVTAVAGNPMILATVAGLTAYGLDWHAPAMILPAVEMLGNVAIPLMLVALGIRLTDVDLTHWRVGLTGGLLAPMTGLAIAVPWVLATAPEPMTRGLLLLFGALPPAVLNYMLAEHYGQEPARVASIVAIGNGLAIVIIPMVLVFVV